MNRLKSILVAIGIAGCLLFGCQDGDKLYTVQDNMICTCVPMDQDAGVAQDATNPDASNPDASPPPYMPPHTADAGIDAGTPDAGGMPCIRWQPNGGSCWFLSSLKDDDFDLLCEDNLVMGAWCECLGSDWGAEQNRGLSQSMFPECKAPW